MSNETQPEARFRGQILAQLGVDPKRPWGRLPKGQRERLLHGTGERTYRVRWSGKTGKGSFDMHWEGVLPRLMRRFKQTGSERAKRWYGQWLADSRCSSCKGARLRPESTAVVVGDEWQEGELTVRDLRTGHEERIGVEMIVEHLRGLRG